MKIWADSKSLQLKYKFMPVSLCPNCSTQYIKDAREYVSISTS